MHSGAVGHESAIRLIESIAKGARHVDIDAANRHFLDAQSSGARLNPELHGEVVAAHIKVEVRADAGAIGLVATESIGNAERKPLVELAGKQRVDASAVFGSGIAGQRLIDIARTGDQICLAAHDRGHEVRQARGLVLLIAVHRDHPVVAAKISPFQHVLHRSAVATVLAMTNDLHRMGGENGRGRIGRAVVDHQDLAVESDSVSRDLGQHAVHRLLLIEDGNRNKNAGKSRGHGVGP